MGTLARLLEHSSIVSWVNVKLSRKAVSSIFLNNSNLYLQLQKAILNFFFFYYCTKYHFMANKGFSGTVHFLNSLIIGRCDKI